MSYWFADSLRAGAYAVRNTQNFIPRKKFEKLGHLVGFNIRIYHDARSRERQI